MLFAWKEKPQIRVTNAILQKKLIQLSRFSYFYQHIFNKESIHT